MDATPIAANTPTGATMRAAVMALKQRQVARCVVGVPVSSPETCAEFRAEVDEIVCVIFLGSPEFRTLPRQIWSGVKETISPTITVAAVMLIIAAILLVSAVELLRRRTHRLRGDAV